MFKTGDKVRHARDVSKGWNDYGIGEVLGYDANLNVYNVRFQNDWHMTQFSVDDLVLA